MNIFPSKSQWNRWSLPSKAGYIGACIGVIALVLAILIPLLHMVIPQKNERPLISIISLDSYLSADSMETKFVIKNAGTKPAFILITDEAFIDGRRIEVRNRNSESGFQMIMPDQYVKYRGLVIEGKTYQTILNGQLSPTIMQNIKIDYGDTEKSIGDYYIFQSVRLDVAKLVKFKNQSNITDGFWLIEKSNFR